MILRAVFVLISSALLFTLFNCSNEEALADLEQDLFLGVGKWKITKKRTGSTLLKETDCDVTDLILNSNLSYKIYTSNNAVLIGSYTIISSNEIALLDNLKQQIGTLSNVSVVDNNISFDIKIDGVCQNALEGEKDESYEENKTFIADVAFEKYLIEEGLDDIEDNYVLTSNISTIEQIDAQERNISSLTGIEDFKNLKYLSAGRNNISGVIDFSLNTKLVYVDIPNNPLSEVYFKSNSFLESLGLYGTYTLEVLVLSNSPNLFDLGIHDTKLKELDLSNSPKIEHLRIWDSELSELDLSNQNSLKYLYAYNIFSNNSSSLILPETSTLEMIWLDRNNIINLDLSKNKNLKVVSCNDCQLEEMTLPESQSLYGLLVERNQLTNLNLTNNPNLRILRAESNLLSCISVHSSLIDNIPPTCQEANIPLNYDDDPNFSCYNPWNIVDFAFNSEAENFPDSWMYDPNVVISTNCN
ncbi:MAG: hypothetical protein ACON4M_02255 [Crocinitomicaceae bacterium]